MTERLQFVLRTPHEVVLEVSADSVRVSTASGQVGLRPRQEPLLLAVEAGLVIVHEGPSTCFAATAGGLLDGDRERAVLLSPFAVVGDRAADVLEALDRALATPDGELAARRRLGELEQRIVGELRRRPRAPQVRSPR